MEGDLQAYEGAAFLANTKPQTDEDSFEYDIIQIYTPCATTTATIMSSRRIALSMYTALLTAAFGVDKKMLPENPLKHEMKLLKFEHNKLKNTQVDDKTYYNIIHLKT